MFQPDVIAQAEGIERIGDEPILFPAGIDARGLRIGERVDAANIELPPLGYAAAAIESYVVFTRLRAEGAVPAGIRFQVSLPAPLVVISSFFHGDNRAAIEPVYTAAILRDLDEILAAIPQEDLSVQWDVVSEMGIIERAVGYGAVMEAWWPGEPLDDLVERLAALAGLASLDELYLGLVHREDGAEGAARRIAAAAPFAPMFGVATECGIGRAPAGSTEGILRTHAEVAPGW